MRTRAVVSVIAISLLGACEGDPMGPGPAGVASSPALPNATSAGDVSLQSGVPSDVQEVRAGILNGVESGDYASLRQLLDVDVFLSDFGYGVDPIGRWESMGDEPLRLMGAVLEMSFQKRKTNEGVLYEWPVYSAESVRSDLRVDDRRIFLEVMSPGEVRELFVPEYGYVGPRLGILRDGTWWFFLTEGRP